MGDVVSFLSMALNAVFSFADDVFTKLGAYGLILGAFFIWTVYRLLLQPIIGGIISVGTSDVVQKTTKTGKYDPNSFRNRKAKGNNKNGL